ELREVRLQLVVREGRLVGDGAAFGRVVLLRLREEVRLAAGLRDLRADCEAERLRRAERVHVEAAAVADTTGPLSAPPERQRDAVVGLAGEHPRAHRDRLTVDGELDQVLALDAESLG